MVTKLNNEGKDEKFKRLVTARTQKILNYIRLLGNCSNRSIYSYEDKDINKIFNTIEQELRETKMKFENKKNKKFTL